MKTKKKKQKKVNNGAQISIKAAASINVIILIIALLIHVYNIKTIESQIREKAKKNKEIKALQSEIDDLVIHKQKLLEYERIKKISKEKLGLVPNLQVNEKIVIDKRELQYLKKIIDGKYE